MSLPAAHLIPKVTQRHGDYEVCITIDGLEFLVTYDLDGKDLPATREFPAERADVLVVSVAIGDREVFGVDAEAWNDRLELWDIIQAVRS